MLSAIVRNRTVHQKAMTTSLDGIRSYTESNHCPTAQQFLCFPDIMEAQLKIDSAPLPKFCTPNNVLTRSKQHFVPLRIFIFYTHDNNNSYFRIFSESILYVRTVSLLILTTLTVEKQYQNQSIKNEYIYSNNLTISI